MDTIAVGGRRFWCLLPAEPGGSLATFAGDVLWYQRSRFSSTYAVTM